MEIHQFIDISVEKLTEKLGSTTKVVADLEDDESINLHGILITDCMYGVTQLIYIDCFYEVFVQTKDIDKIIDAIIRSYKSNLENIKKMLNIDVEWYRSFECVKNNIFYRLVEDVGGADLLRGIISEPFLDMTKFYYVYDQSKEMFKNGYIILHETHLRMWGVTEEEIKAVAEENMQKQPVDIFELEALTSDNLPIYFITEVLGDVLVMRSRNLKYGATAMCNLDVLKELAEEKQQDIFIIPTSVHEVMLVVNIWNSDDELDMVVEMEDILNEVNMKNKTHEDTLSSSIYVYRRSTGTIEIA